MTLEHLKIAVVVAWALICIVIAVSLATSATHWILMVGSGVLPPLVMLRMWPLARMVPSPIGARK